MAKWLKNEFWNGYTTFERIFFASLIVLQIVMYFIVPDTAIGIICGLSGVVCVALTAKGKISSYIFNFIQMITYMIICWEYALYLEFGEQVFYFIVCVFGVFMWKKNMRKNSDGTEYVRAKKFKIWQWVITAAVVLISTLLLGYFGESILGSTLPYLDAMTVALAIIAQLLMVWRYREQWACWIIIDVISLIMFIILGQWSMVAMYIAWTANAIYGWYNWTRLQGKETSSCEHDASAQMGLVCDDCIHYPICKYVAEHAVNEFHLPRERQSCDLFESVNGWAEECKDESDVTLK